MKILWVKSWKINNNQIRYFHINSGTTTKQIFSLLHTVQGDNKYEIEELMNDCATKFIASEEIKLTDNQDNAVVFTSEVNVYVVDKGTTYTKWLKTNEKRKNLEENTWHLERQSFSTFSREVSSWGQSFLPILRKCFSFDSYE